MPESSRNVPELRFRTPTFATSDHDIERSAAEHDVIDPSGEETQVVRQRFPSRERSQGENADSRPPSPTNVYLGSYAHTTHRGSIAARASSRTPPASPRGSTSHIQLEHLLPQTDLDLETYGIEELRPAFFDTEFHQPLKRRTSELRRKASTTLPQAFEKYHPLSLKGFLRQQAREIRGFLQQLRTRAGIRLFKSFLGVFIAYVICLIPASRDWLGRYNYILVISAIINHPGRAVGSQLDGAALTVLGTIAGLGWGSLALYISIITEEAQNGFGGVLATFLIIFTATIGFFRCIFIRFYQGTIAAGVSIFYVCLADTSQDVSWRKVYDYGIPWALGQALCLIVAFSIYPNSGARSLRLAIHEALKILEKGLIFPYQEELVLRRDLAYQFVKLSGAVRDFTLEFTFSPFRAEDSRILRNLLQSSVRSILAIKCEPSLFAFPRPREDAAFQPEDLIKTHLQAPTQDLIDTMRGCVYYADKVIYSMTTAQRTHAVPQNAVVNTLREHLADLAAAKEGFDKADTELLEESDVTTAYKGDVVAIRLFLFIHPLRETANHVETLGAHVLKMQQKNKAWRVRAPSYPWHKAVMRTNAQVRHDRGGLTAGIYFRTKNQLDRAMADLQNTTGPQYIDRKPESNLVHSKANNFGDGTKRSKTQSIRYKLWTTLHRLQGFESRFAFKLTLVATLLSIPAWLPQSRGWWNANEVWWTVVTVWLMMHPRVSGTPQDLFVRCLTALIGATWGGLAYRAGNGNPYVMGVFAAIFYLPMLYRFTQSSHPRSGIMGCFVFTVVSLDTYTAGGKPSIFTIAWTRGSAFVVGIVAAVLVNWLLWPFIARHELRKSLSATMLHLAILYRRIISSYVYQAEGEPSNLETTEKSEILEGRMREGFVRLRQLLELTRHEIRLRAPFDPLPYSALISSCESFFENLVQVRQSSLYFQPAMLSTDPVTTSSLTAPRRDAVAVILMNLYSLASALRADQPVPRYLPSAAAARKKLLDRMEVVEAEYAARMRAEDVVEEVGEGKRRRRWAGVYHYAYSSALTEIVQELQQLQRYTKEICGEVEWG